MRNLFCLLGVLLSGVCVFAAGSPPATNLKILSLNFNAEADNTLLFQKRLQFFEQTIVQKNLDLVLIQEGWPIGQAQTVATRVAQDLGMDVAYHFEDGVAGIRASSIAILAKKNLKFHHPQYFKLPHSAVTIGNGQSTWAGLGEVNMLIGGSITLSNGASAFVWTTHLSTQSSDDRLDQVRAISAHINDALQGAGQTWDDSTIFLTGDLNALPGSAEINYLKSIGLQDSWELSHPDDLGLTYVSDNTDPEYNPMTHNAGFYPSQYSPDDTARIDYVWAHIPGSFSAGVTRTFTAPIQNVWMSDHYGLTANFVFGDSTAQNAPSADSEISSAVGTNNFFFGNHLKQLPKKKDFVVNSEKGMTFVNQTSYHVRVYFDDDNGAVYNSDDAFLTAPGIVTFLFFKSGNFHYRMVISDLNDQTLAQMYGQIQVHLPSGL